MFGKSPPLITSRVYPLVQALIEGMAKLLQQHGKHLPTAETQRLCRAYASEQVERQKKDFRRLGVLGDWDHPYLTMAFRNEADEIRALGKLLEKGYVYRGLKPVNWCFDCGSALAEAEV